MEFLTIRLQEYARRAPGRARKAGVWFLAAGQTIVWAGLYYSFAALLLSWESALGWAKTELTLGLTVAVLIAAILSPVSGRIVDAGFGRWLLAVGALLGAGALAALATIEQPGTFVLAWALIGVAQSACLYEPCFALVTRTTGSSARSVITRITLVAGFASPIAFPAGAVFAELLGWRGAVLVFSLAVAFIGAPLLFAGATLLEYCASAPDQSDQRQRNKAAVRAAMARPEFWILAVAFPMMALNHGILLNHIIPILVERGFTKTTAVAVASVFGPMQVAGRLLIWRFEGRIGSLVLAIVSFGGVLAAALLLLSAGASAILVFAFAATQGAAYGLVSILKPVVTADTLGRTAFGVISGRLALPYLAATAFGPFFGALLWQWGGYDLAIATAAALAAIGLICIAALSLLQNRRSRL